MTSTDRVLSLLILSLGFTLACASPGDGPSPQGCSGDEQCSSTARCIASACVENVPPVADFSVSGDMFAASEITLDASASHDTDTGDAVGAYKWEVSAGSSSTPECQAPTIASTEKIAHVIFACAGSWDVKLVVYDTKQAASAAVTKTVTIAARTGGAIITAGASQGIGHVCSGTPLKCTTATVTDTASTPTSVQLSAALNAQTPLSVRWSVDRRPAGREAASVTFDDPTSLTPKVVIATNGSPISGDWVLRVDALNGATVVASSTTQVSVENRRPVIHHASVQPFDHKYDSANQAYIASGKFSVQAIDPDGDPLTQTAERHHTGDGGSPFQVDYDGSEVTFTILVPGTSPSWLIGGAELSRSIAFSALDSNGASTSKEVPVVVANHSPYWWGGGEFTTTGHSYDANNRAYVAKPAFGVWSEKDGDPLVVTVSSTLECGDAQFSKNTEELFTLRVTCTKPFSSVYDLPAFLGSRPVTVTVSDAWSKGSADFTLSIENNAPKAATALSFSAPVSCERYGGSGFCPGSGSSATHNDVFAASTFTYTLAPSIVDPDGDPLQVVPNASISTVPTSGTNPTIKFTLPRTEYCSSVLPSTSISFTVSDGVSTPNFTLPIQPVCG